MVFVCEELCNLSFEKRSWNQDNNNYRTKTLNRSVHYLSLHCRTIHHRWEFFLYVSCRWEKKKTTIIVTFPAEMMKNEGPVSAVTERTFSWPAPLMTKYIFVYLSFEDSCFQFKCVSLLTWFISAAFNRNNDTMTKSSSIYYSVAMLYKHINLFLNYYSCLLFTYSK